MCITLIRYYYYLLLVYCNTIYDSKQLIKHFFIDKQRVTAAPTGKYVCSKEMHLPRKNTELHGIRRKIRAGSISDGKQRRCICHGRTRKWTIKAFSPRRRKGKQVIWTFLLLLSVLSVFAVKILGFGAVLIGRQVISWRAGGAFNGWDTKKPVGTIPRVTKLTPQLKFIKLVSH